MITCKYCSADVKMSPYRQHEFCTKKCYHLYKRADNTGYLANHLNLMSLSYTEFHKVVRNYLPKFSMQSLKQIATFGMNMQGGYREGLPCEVAMKIGCAIYDFDSEYEGFDYRRLFEEVEGYEMVVGGFLNTNAFYAAISTLFGDTSRS